MSVRTWYHMVLPQYGNNTPLLEPKLIDSVKNIYLTAFGNLAVCCKGLLQSLNGACKIKGALIRGKLAGGAWCCSWHNCWIQGPSKNGIFVVLYDILTNGISGPWIYFFAL